MPGSLRSFGRPVHIYIYTHISTFVVYTCIHTSLSLSLSLPSPRITVGMSYHSVYCISSLCKRTNKRVGGVELRGGAMGRSLMALGSSFSMLACYRFCVDVAGLGVRVFVFHICMLVLSFGVTGSGFSVLWASASRCSGFQLSGVGHSRSRGSLLKFILEVVVSASQLGSARRRL